MHGAGAVIDDLDVVQVLPVVPQQAVERILEPLLAEGLLGLGQLMPLQVDGEDQAGEGQP